MNDTIRNADLADLAALLQDQHSRKLDMIVPASKLSSVGANLVVTGAEPIIDEDGVTEADGVYRPTSVCDEGVADRLNIPVGYVKRLRAERPDIYDENVNGLLHGGFGEPKGEDGEMTFYPEDTRRFMLRAFSDGKGGGVARALLSDQYRIVDNLDVLTAALEGIRDAGVNVEIDGCDLTDRRMYVRVVCPEISALAPVLLDGYRSPFDGHGGNVNGIARAGAGWQPATYGTAPSGHPIVFAGFVLSNSEVGGGAFSIVPRLVVQVCTNGMTIKKDALRAVHLGGKLDEGVIRWSHETQQKNLELVASQAKDAVSTFLDVDYLTKAIRDIEAKAGVEITRPVNEVVETVGKRLRFGDDRIAGVLDHFIRGGQMTAGGVVNAVTSYAQTIDDADAAHEFEGLGLDALDLAAALA